MRRGEKPAKAKVQAKRPARISGKSEGSKLRHLETRLAEALEREKATGEILRIIGISSTDIQPVFATVAETAARLCKASDASIFRLDGDRLRRVAHQTPPPGVPLLLIGSDDRNAGWPPRRELDGAVETLDLAEASDGDE